MPKIKILYLMHVPWNWIKQRPHYFAESLNDDYDVDVIYKKPFVVNKENLKNNPTSINNIRSYFILPYHRIKFLRPFSKIFNFFNWIIIKCQLNFNKYDLIWITSSSLYSLIENNYNHKKTSLYYDCMDDELEFPEVKHNEFYLEQTKKNEKKLVKHADKIICSSAYLAQKILTRNQSDRNDLVVVNNAVSIPHTSDQNNVDEILKNLTNIVMYVGAISSWFDFDAVLYATQKLPNVNFVLIGPTDIEIPIHSRIHYLGTKQRESIFKLMEYANLLIMPFVVNELIRSVNPVKLYEYIYMRKPILVPMYEETSKFGNFVSFYNTKEEFVTITEQLLSEEVRLKSTEEEYNAFINNNTWKQRFRHIKNLISDNS